MKTGTPPRLDRASIDFDARAAHAVLQDDVAVHIDDRHRDRNFRLRRLRLDLRGDVLEEREEIHVLIL